MRKMPRLSIFPNFFRFAPETSHNPNVEAKLPPGEGRERGEMEEGAV